MCAKYARPRKPKGCLTVAVMLRSALDLKQVAVAKLRDKFPDVEVAS